MARSVICCIFSSLGWNAVTASELLSLPTKFYIFIFPFPFFTNVSSFHTYFICTHLFLDYMSLQIYPFSIPTPTHQFHLFLPSFMVFVFSLPHPVFLPKLHDYFPVTHYFFPAGFPHVSPLIYYSFPIYFPINILLSSSYQMIQVTAICGPWL